MACSLRAPKRNILNPSGPYVKWKTTFWRMQSASDQYKPALDAATGSDVRFAMKRVCFDKGC